MNKRKAALLSAMTMLVGVGATAVVANGNGALQVSGAPKEYSVTFDPSGRPYSGTSRIDVTTELGNPISIVPTNCTAGGNYCICEFKSSGSFLDNDVPFQKITSIDVSYEIPTNNHGISLSFKSETQANLETFKLGTDVVLNEKTTRSYSLTDSSNTACYFRFSSYETGAIIYSITVHYTCE